MTNHHHKEHNMNRTPWKVRVNRRAAVLAVGAAAALVLAGNVTSASSNSVTTSYTTNPIYLTQPSGLPGATSLPFSGVTASSFAVPTTMPGTLTITPDAGPLGTPFTISGAGLPASTSLQLTWSTNKATWVADVEPNTVNYLGDQYTKLTVNLANVTTDVNGAFSYNGTAPTDFGGTHDIYAVQDAGQSDAAAQAHGGFEITRVVSISPSEGPVGTPITVTYTGLGASLYAGGAALLYDNHYVGAMEGHWTRGTATAVIRASGAIGPHFIMVGDAISNLYMNIVQSPLAYVNNGSATFTVTKGNGKIPAPYITWPASVTPTVSEVTTADEAVLDPSSSAVANVSPSRGPVGSTVSLHVSGLTDSGTTTPATGSYSLAWATVAGSRVNCSSTCWNSLTIPLGSASATDGTLSGTFTVPNNLGGFHVVEVLDGSNNIEAEAPFYVKESIVPFTNSHNKVISMGVATANDTTAAIPSGQSGTGTYTFKENQEFTISIYGVGWTQLDNTLSVDYDNGYIGYGCGFASNGYMVIHLFATGGPGLHVIDLHPMLYSLSPSFINTPYGMVPFLSSGNDYPGLALGYQVPTIHFTINVVK
jgi:hypothetical protein